MEDLHCSVRVPDGYRVGPWRVTGGLASGSWSSVYAAVREPGADGGGADLPDTVALKFVPTGTLTSRQLGHLADMTRRELAAHRILSHPHLIAVFGTYVVDDPAEPGLDGATVLALELAERSAAAALAEADGGLPDAPRMVAEVCAGLAHLHEAGWVHGDLKPGNVLLMADGSVRLADFGLAAEMNGTHAYLPPGGTADYMPPERWADGLRLEGTAVRQTADVWALGVTACQLLTGRFPFPGVTSRARTSAAAAYAEGRAGLTLPDGLSPAWRAFVVDCLAPDHAARREHTATTLLARARAAAGEAGGPPHRPGRLRPAMSATGRRWAWAAAGAAVVAAAAAAPFLPTGDGSGTPAPADAGRYAQHFRTDAGIPPQYHDLIVQAGTKCPDQPAVTPHLVAAILKTESNFDPNLADPAKDEFGIARWTPSVLQYYLPPGQRDTKPAPPFPPEMSIPPIGDFLCRFAPELRDVPGDPVLNLVAAWRTSATRVREAGGVPDRPALREYMPRLQANLAAYRPAGTPAPAAS